MHDRESESTQHAQPGRNKWCVHTCLALFQTYMYTRIRSCRSWAQCNTRSGMRTCTLLGLDAKHVAPHVSCPLQEKSYLRMPCCRSRWVCNARSGIRAQHTLCLHVSCSLQKRCCTYILAMAAEAEECAIHDRESENNQCTIWMQNM
jgi:hypothetical protein